VCVRHGGREVAVNRQTEGQRQRVVDRAHLDGIAGRDGPVCQRAYEAPPVP
jgi:hypothetical protein